MIYTANCSGQLCNRIMWFVHVLATAIDCKANIINLFGKDLREFSDLHPEAIPEIKIRNLNFKYSLPLDVLHGWLLRLPCFSEKIYGAENVERCRKFREGVIKGPCLLWNWHFRNYEAIVRHHQKICDYLRVKDEFVLRPNEIMADVRKGNEVVVGVHIRRGDYREAAPDWYFDDPTYLRFMKEFKSSHGGNVKFVAVSNEPVDKAFFESNGIDITVASGRPQEDIVTLSLCDYIMGPASTFSWWAAYYGDKPRLNLHSRDEHVTLDRFKRETEPSRYIVQ